jgi:hypothetical protein
MSYAQHTTPKNLLVYYGWPSCFNSAVNGWDVNKVAEDMARYDVIVLGAGLQDPAHGDHANTVSIIAKIKALKPTVAIFGYVTANQAYATFRDQVAGWDVMPVVGIFCDEAGYDYGVTRAALNEKLGLLHARRLLAFVNAWNPDHVLGVGNDPAFPNSTFNPDCVPSLVRKVDWYLFESLAVNDSAYSGGLEPQAQYVARMVKAAQYAKRVNLASVGIIDAVNDAKFGFLWVAGVMGGLDAVGSADPFYGASSATTHWYVRPQDWPWGNYDTPSPIVPSPADATVLCRFLIDGNVRFRLNWTAGAAGIEHL